jgi:DNA repair exonuclease SbcCD ATPase subunit
VQIARHRKHARFENKILLFVDGREITMGGNPETQAKIEQILQIDQDSFERAVLFAQGAGGFISLTDASQKAVLDKILGTARFAEAQERLKLKIKKFEAGVQSLRVARTLKQSQITQLRATIASLEQQNAQFEHNKREKISKALHEVQQLEASEPRIDLTIDTQITLLREQIDLLKAHDLYSRLQQAQSVLQEQERVLAADKATYEAIKQQVDQAGPEPEQPTEDLELLLARCREVQTRVIETTSQLARNEKELKTARQRQSKRDQANDCPTCNQPLSEAAKDRMFGQLSQDIVQLEATVGKTRELLTSDENLLRLASGSVESLRKKAEAWRTWKARTECAAKLPQLEANISDRATTLESMRNECCALAAQYKTIYETAVSLNQQVATLAQKKQAEQQAHSLWKTQAAAARATLSQVEKEQSPYSAMITQTQRDLAAVESSIGMSEVVERTLARDLQYLEFWKEGFGNAGVKSLLLDTVLPFLSYRASEYLEALTGGTASVEFNTQKTLATGEKRDKLDISVSYAFGGNTYKGVSGGERRRVDLVPTEVLRDWRKWFLALDFH